MTRLLSPLTAVVVICSMLFLAFGGVQAAFDYHPRNIHLALYGDQSQEMRVTWTTTDYTEGDYTPVVHYGALMTNLPWVATQCETTTYTKEEYHHNCILSHVTANNRFYYRIGNKPGQTSIVTDFVMPPGLGQVQKSILLGDLGLENGQNTARLLEILNNDKSNIGILPRVSHIHHCGDLSYADDAHRGKPNPDFEPINNKFAEMLETASSRVPYMVAIGNHDISASLTTPDDQLPEWGRNATHYNHRWKMPSATSDGAASMWYAYTIGNTRFIVVNTETDHKGAPLQPDSGDIRAGGFGDQESWLISQLEKANRPESRLFQPWVVVIGHRPIISTLILDFPPNQQENTRAWLQPLLQKYKVDLYVCGHSHLYERSYPMIDGKMTQANYTNPQGPVYIVNGAAGNMEGHPVPGKEVSVEIPAHIPFRESQTYNVALLETFASLPPKTPNTVFDNNTGDYLNLNRLHNHTPSQKDMDAFYDEFEIKLRKTSKKFTEPATLDTSPCPNPRSQAISMCYSVYPAFADAEVFIKQKYMDRICLVKCL